MLSTILFSVLVSGPPGGHLVPTPLTPRDTGSEYFTHVGRAADAPALLETITLIKGGRGGSALDYIGKARIVQTGTWTEAENIVTLALSRSDDLVIHDTLTLTRSADGLIMTRGDIRTVYTRTTKVVLDL